MLEQIVGVTFFLKVPKNKSKIRTIYLRVNVDGIPKEISTRKKWDVTRWDQKIERAIGFKEDAKTLNFFLDSLVLRINMFTSQSLNDGRILTPQLIIDFVQGKTVSKAKLLEEFRKHNNELFELVGKGEYAMGTYQRYATALSHIEDFIKFNYRRDDMEFRELNYEFIKDYEFYLKTVKSCCNNTAIKYIKNLKKIVLRAVAKDIISSDPFKLYKIKLDKTDKKPLTRVELKTLENKVFSTERLTEVRDVFVFQCYTGLAYIDVFQLKRSDIKEGIDGTLWIMSNRQKTKSNTDIPLLPKAMEIMEKYKNHPICEHRGSVLPVKTNQKMNEYLKEIATLCGFHTTLNTHKARRTFGSTVTLANGVPIHIVKELLGHHSVKQTEEYAITEQESISKEMIQLKYKLQHKPIENPMISLSRLEKEINDLENQLSDNPLTSDKLKMVKMEIDNLKRIFNKDQLLGAKSMY